MLCSAAIPTYNQAILFNNGELNQAIHQGNQENKYIFVNTFSKYCNLCPNASSNLFQEPQVSSYYNQHFVNYNLNLDDPRYNNLAHILDLGTHSTMLFLNKQGYILHRTVGVNSSHALLHAGKFIIENKPNIPNEYQNYQLMLRKFDLGYDDPHFLFELAKLAKRLEESSTIVVNKYLATQSPSQLKNEQNRRFIYAFTDNIDTHAIDYFLQDIQHFKNVLRGDVINQKIKVAIYNGIRTAIELREHQLFEKALRIIDATDLAYEEDFRFHVIAEYAEGTHNWTLYHKAATDYIQKYGQHNAQLLNKVARKYFHVFSLHRQDRKLRQAIQWAEQSIQIQPAYDNYLTLAYLQRQVGECEAAHKAAVKAIYLAQDYGTPFIEADKLREAIELRGCK